MFAAKSHEAEQELPEGIPEPRNVTREWRRPVATGAWASAIIRYPMPLIGPLAFQLMFGRTSARFCPQASRQPEVNAECRSLAQMRSADIITRCPGSGQSGNICSH